MATESELRDLLHGSDPEGRAVIDVDAVLHGARRRRRPRLIAATAAGTFALVGVLTPVVVLSLPTTQQTSVMVAEDSSGGAAPETASGDAAQSGMSAAGTLNTCQAPLVADLPSPDGLVLEVTPVDVAAGSDDIPIDVTLRNDSSARVVGSTGPAPVITLSADGVVLWHSSGIAETPRVPVDLEPGESMSYTATFEPVICGREDESDLDGFGEDLPDAAPGAYLLSAAIDFVPNDGATGLVTGPVAPAELR